MASLPRMKTAVAPAEPFPTDEVVRVLRARIRAVRNGGGDWSMRTSELLSTGLERVVAAGRATDHWLEGARLHALLHTIARNVVVDAIRRKVCERRALAVIRSRSREAHPEGASATSEREELLAAVLQALTPADRFLLTARARGMTWERIGAELGMNRDTARQRWCLLRVRVRRTFDAATSGGLTSDAAGGTGRPTA